MRPSVALIVFAVCSGTPGSLIGQHTDLQSAQLADGHLPGSTAVASEPVVGDVGAAPLGLTGIYDLEVKSSDGQRSTSLAVLFEDPSGRITGGLLLPHRSGYYDAVLIAAGRRPGLHRDVEWRAGDHLYSGFVLEEGKISGEVFGAGGPASFEAELLHTPDEELAGLYDLEGTDGATVSRLALALLQPPGTGDRLYAVGHLWGRSDQGRIQRRTFLARGAAAGDRIVLEDYPGVLQISLDFGRDVVVAGRIADGPGSGGRDLAGRKRGAEPPSETLLAALLEVYRLAVEREDDVTLRQDLYRGEIPRSNAALLRKLFQYADELSVALVTRELQINGDRARAIVDQRISFRHSVTGERRQTHLTLRMEFERKVSGWQLRSFERV